MARPKKWTEEVEQVVVPTAGNTPVEKIVPLEHADFNTIKEKINEIINYLNAL